MSRISFLHQSLIFFCLSVVMALLITPTTYGDDSQRSFLAGFAKLDISPDQPLRLSGYGDRSQPFSGIDEPLFVRAMAMAQGDSQTTRVLVSVDTIGFPAAVSDQIFESAQKQHGLSRDRLAICFTHNHTSPQIAGGLRNIYDNPLTEEESAATQAYTDVVRQHVNAAIDAAINDLKPARLLTATGEVTFARNRRVIADGLWTGFGETMDGPVDHSLPVLKITDATGNVVRGIVFNYACHCTTFGSKYNRVNGDWAGYAAQFLEQSNAGSIAMCTIGCGADANPQRDAEHDDRAMELAKSQGQQIADEVMRLMTGSEKSNAENPWKDITPATADSVRSSYGFAGLAIDRPEHSELQEALEDKRSQVRVHAQTMLDMKKRMGRLPETYPMPIQVWRLGTGGEDETDGDADDKPAQFVMVFLGGEVTSEYAFRIREELAEQHADLNPSDIWVSSYANDVFGYVVPERMREEGGYEVDYSMIYYLQPGRWSSGTEDVILARVNQTFAALGKPVSPLTVAQSLSTFSTSDDLKVRLVASEPLIRDPVNFAVDADGSLWVVEMGDYPRGNPDDESSHELANAEGNHSSDQKPWDGKPGGCIKRLTDTNSDGTYDTAEIFLDGLTFPTGVMPWNDGVLIASAPDIIFAIDSDNDGKCDSQEIFYTGFEEANPQHRVNGFQWGLDGWLYLAAGNHSNGTVTSNITGETVETSGRDIRLDPSTGAIEAVSGSSQWGRCRDEIGNWYGDDNTRPLYQFVIEERHLKRNPFVASPSPRVMLTDPPVSPPIYPTSRTTDRFNDLHTANRFTSACSPTILCNETGDDQTEALICEPVHNLISRLVIHQDEVAFSGSRRSHEQQSEYFASTDPWFRPVRVISAPTDESVWVCDMYRQVVEHPEWIPEAWQARLDLYAGSDRGRIYALGKSNGTPHSVRPLDQMSDAQLVSQLKSNNRWRRDTAQRLLLEHLGSAEPADSALEDTVNQIDAIIADKTMSTACRIQAMWTLQRLAPNHLQTMKPSLFQDDDHALVSNTIQAAGVSNGVDNVKWDASVMDGLIGHASPIVRFQVALALGDLPAHQRKPLADLAAANVGDVWIRAAVLSSAVGVADEVMAAVFETKSGNTTVDASRSDFIDGLIATTIGKDTEQQKTGLVKIIKALRLPAKEDAPLQLWQIRALGSSLASLKNSNVDFRSVLNRGDQDQAFHLSQIESAIASAYDVADDRAINLDQRVAAARLCEFSSETDDVADLMTDLMTASQPIELQKIAVETLANVNRVAPLIEGLRSSGPQLQSKIQSTLTTRKEWIYQLIDAVETEELSIADLMPTTVELISQHDDQGLRERWQKQLKTQTTTNRGQILTDYNNSLTMVGDFEAGKAVFSTNCANCHRIGELGKSVGPELSSLQNKTPDYLLTAILDPNRAIESKYRAYKALINDGRLLVGMVVEESATSVKLALADGSNVSILRSDIEQLAVSSRSFMPEGFEKTINQKQMGDLLTYLIKATGAQ